ncbi:HIT family protein [Micromonospora zamorensis]|uniref:HIT family protein n=1 Tax=Micromonospora zamorensis TaxID=709883 RepID=UPI002ED58948|nr:HIT domain-containing protein [Micromonospora zamorensis]
MTLTGNGLAPAEDCIFCAIVRGEVEASLVHQDDEIVAFMDLHPVTPGHLLVVPRLHAVGLEDLPEDVGGRMWTQAHRLAGALRRSRLQCEGVNMFLADGEAAFQEIFHVHLHVFPRFAGDTFRIDADWRRRERVELDAAATAVREGMTSAATSLPAGERPAYGP